MKKNQTVNVIGAVTMVTLFAKLLGIVRESLQARSFGTLAAARSEEHTSELQSP